MPKQASSSAQQAGQESTRIGENKEPGIVCLKRRAVFENTVFYVFSDHISDSNGHEVPQYMSAVPRCLTIDAVAGVAVLPVHEGKVGLIRIFRHPLERWSWEVVKGHIEADEDIREAAARELQEETGFSISPKDLVDLGAVSPEAGVIKARTRLFVVRLNEITGGTVNAELGHGEIAFYDPEEIDDLISRGMIEDASTLVIILKYMRITNGF